MITPDSPIEVVFGRKHGKRDRVVKGLGLTTVGDLLLHFPRRYVQAGELTAVTDLQVGQQLTLVGEVVSSRVAQFLNRRTGRQNYRLEVRLATDGPEFVGTFFLPYANLAHREAARMAEGRRGVFTGKVKRFRDTWQLEQPHAVMFGGDAGPDEEAMEGADEQAYTASLTGLMPIYPLTQKVYSWDLQVVIQFALGVVTGLVDELTPALRKRYGVVDVRQALEWIHAPDDHAQVAAARKRFRFVEALVLQLVLARRRAALAGQGAQARVGRADGEGLLGAFDERLPFALTAGQCEVGALIEQELAQPRPMNRLLQGEVGSGKTVVALRAMLRVVDSGGQAVLLAPTEVLAQQHYRSLTTMLGDLASGGMLGGAAEATGVALLTGSLPKPARREALLRIASGEAGLVIGTHALLEDHVSFADLGLVVVDEQHRFGVEQRAALTDKAQAPPHLLVMTATPIPRTVAMTVFGDLEVSTLTELPAGRGTIATNVVPLAEQPHWLDRVWERVREEVAKGHQVYVVCPRITADVSEAGETDVIDVDDEGEPLAPKRPLAAVEDVHEALTSGPLAGVEVGLLHGRLAAEEKDRVMRGFAAGQIDVLIATTVIEVGVDVGNATMMVLLDADRFGVSQLHQLRGRVGRGGHPGLCLLVSYAEAGSPARDRLEAVAATTDGFELSKVDLEQRREGDVLGASQSGRRSSLLTLRVLRDEETILAAREAAEALLAEDPELARAPELAKAVRRVEASAESDYLEKS